MSSQLGTELKRSKYRLLGLVGQGQFGRVFCAAHRQTGRLVALKDLDRQRFPTHKFLRELRFLLSLQHPNIVTCQALEHTATGRYLVMDYCEGGTLRSVMTEESRLSLPQSLKLVADILAGLDHAHSRGIVHCDIKPENILLNVEQRGWSARVSDFGIARLCQEITGSDFGNTGSPAYMAPERFYGQYSLTSDLYSVGILLFELIAGHRPFSGTPAELMSAHLNRPVKIPDTVPEIWRSLIITALQKLSARRFRSAAEMLTALRSIATQDGSDSELDSQAIHLPLLQTSTPSAWVPLQSKHQELLRYPLTGLTVIPRSNLTVEPDISGLDSTPHSLTCLYRAEGNRVSRQIYLSGIFDDSERKLQPNVSEVASFETAILQLLPRSQGCFVITARSLYLLPSIYKPELNLAPQSTLDLEQDGVMAIDPQGRWVAALTTDLPAGETLRFRSLLGAGVPRAIAQHAVSIALKHHAPDSPQLLVLDTRHVAVFAELATRKPSQAESKAGESLGTLVRVVTRRGNLVGSLSLPIQIGQAILTPTPYRILAVDRVNPQTVLLIDLKPYRILRLGVEIVPKFLLATAWGYILASQTQIVLLDQDGRQVGQIEVASAMTAIASFSHYGLLVATWDGQQGCLHTVDLREAGVDLLF